MHLNLISMVTFLLPLSRGADILAVLPTPSYSHQIAYAPLWRELSLRGHKVTVITTDPLKDPKLTNLTEIDVGLLSYKYFSDISKMGENTMTMWNVNGIFHTIMRRVIEAQLTHPSVQDLIHNKTRFDVVFAEFFHPEYLAFAEIYKCPKILFSSMDADSYFHGILGNPSHPILHPDLISPFHGSLTFTERIKSTLLYWWIIYFYNHNTIPGKQNIVQKYFNVTLSLDEMINDTDMLFVNVNPIIQGPRAVGPTTINVGGHRRDKSPKYLPKDLKEFLDDAKDGFIYFSLGSNMKSKDLNEQTLNAIIESLREVPYKVLWKFEADELPRKPDNVKLVKWAPQQNILSHPNIKLFVMQGGLQSMEEAIYSAVPMVVIPFFADQGKNAKLMADKGIAKTVEREPFVKKDDLKNAILEVINNPSYKNAVQWLKQLALDTPMTGLETAVWWTEYVIRNKGAKHLRNPAADLPIYQYYLIDVISCLIASAAFILVVTIGLTKILLHMFVGRQILRGKKLQ